MSSIEKTSIVYNDPNKLYGLPPFYYRWRVCNTNLTGNTPADQYQKLKLIQNTARVYSSLYTSNLGPLNAYRRPTTATQGVCWNQMSDRPVPSVQKHIIPTGSATSMNRRHTSVTSSKPGCQSPGGIGCDIKHNSYDRYLNRLKGKGPLRRGVIPKTFGEPIPFNPAFPVYGGKTTKTNLVSGCDCPPEQTNKQMYSQDVQIYNNPLWQPEPTGTYNFSVGEYVYAMQNGNDFYTRAIITSIVNDTYTIKFDNETIQTITNKADLLIYFPCNCGSTINDVYYATGVITNASILDSIACNLSANVLTNGQISSYI
jgi:hypothetical protein